MIINKYPSIKFVALEIAYDNGVINRYTSIQNFLESTDEVLGADGVTDADLVRLEAYLSGLTQEQRVTLASGEEQDVVAIEQCGPFGGPDNAPLCFLFTEIFEICCC
jgi:hypothetical protein